MSDLKAGRYADPWELKDKKSAKNIAIDYEVEIIKEILGFKKPKEPVLFSKLYTLYISADHEWSRNTYLLNELALRKYDKTRILPENLNTRAIYLRCINTCLRWGKRNGYECTDVQLLEGKREGPPRLRVLTDEELEVIFGGITPEHFNRFVKFAYYTGARAGEIRGLEACQY